MRLGAAGAAELALRPFVLGALILALGLGPAGKENGKAEPGPPVLVVRPAPASAD